MAIRAAEVKMRCAYLDTATAPDVSIAVDPLSKVTRSTATLTRRCTRMNWPDDFVQVAGVVPSRPGWLTGAIGTSGFPSTIEIPGHGQMGGVVGPRAAAWRLR